MWLPSLSGGRGRISGGVPGTPSVALKGFWGGVGGPGTGLQSGPGPPRCLKREGAAVSAKIGGLSFPEMIDYCVALAASSGFYGFRCGGLVRKLV